MPDAPATPPAADPNAGATNTPPTGNAPTPPAAGVTSPDNKNAELTIPKYRFDEQTRELKELREKEAAREAETKKADEERLKKQGEWEKLAAQKDEEATQAKTQLQTERINNKLIVEASKQGVVDPDAVLALVARGDIKIDADGTITGIEEAVKALVESKPYLKGGSINQPTVGNGTNPGSGSNAPITKFTRSQIEDPKFYREHATEIKKAAANGLIVDD